LNHPIYIHLYVVVIKGTTNLLHSYAVVTLHGGIGRPPVMWRVGNPLSLYIVSREYIFRLPGNHSVNQSGVEYTSLELRQIAVEQIRFLQARLEVHVPSSSHSHSTRLSIFSHHPTLNLRTKISLPRDCIVVTHKACTYAGLFFHILRNVLQFSKREAHIHDISNTYVSFPQLFAIGKSLKSVGIGMPRDKNNGLHGNCLIGPQLGHAEPILIYQP
jgi:hypothetical protein